MNLILAFRSVFTVKSITVPITSVNSILDALGTVETGSVVPALPVFRTRHGSEIVSVSVRTRKSSRNDIAEIQKAKDLDIADGSSIFFYFLIDSCHQ